MCSFNYVYVHSSASSTQVVTQAIKMLFYEISDEFRLLITSKKVFINIMSQIPYPCSDHTFVRPALVAL